MYTLSSTLSYGWMLDHKAPQFRTGVQTFVVGYNKEEWPIPLS